MFTMTSFSANLEICLQIDLILTLKSPFSRTGPRQITSVIVSLAVALIIGATIVLTDYDLNNPVNYAIFFGQKGIFFVSAICSTFVAVHSYYTKGLSK